MAATPKFTIDLARTEEPEGVSDAWTVFPAEKPEQVVARLHRLIEDKTLVIVPTDERVGDEPIPVGDRKLDSIRTMREKVATLLGLPVEQPKMAPKPKKVVTATESNPDATVTEIEQRIAQLEKEIAEQDGKPEFAKAAASRRGQITRVRKQLPTSAAHTA